MLYDRNGEYEVATFTNASFLREEADYYGFEEYEQNLGWEILPSGAPLADYLDSTNAHTGTRSIKLSASTTGDNSLRRTLQPAQQNGKYLFSFRVKTEAGFAQAGEEAGWEITVQRNGNVLGSEFVPFQDTGGSWSYVSRAVDLASYVAGNAMLTVTLAAYNETERYALLDNIRFSAFVGGFSANVFDPRFDLVTAALGPNMETARSLYDAFQRQVADVGPVEQVNSLAQNFFSRQAAPIFQTAQLNSEIALQGMEYGFYSDFRRDGGYADHWHTDEGRAWNVVDGALVHSETGAGRITLRDPFIDRRYAAFIQTQPTGALSAPLGLAVGDALTIEYLPAEGVWRLRDLAANTELTAASVLQKNWLAIVNDRVVQFYGDGEQLFAYIAPDDVIGALSLTAAGTVAFSNIALCAKPQITVKYSDGAGQERQTCGLDGVSSLIAQTVYDGLGRPAVKTKPARIEPDGSYPLLSYRADFVESFDWISGVMHGAVSRYYSAEGAGFSDDQGYPYTRELYERSPLGRVIETGSPGRPFAIVDPDTTAPEERHTTKNIYSGNTRNGFMQHLPENQYLQTITIDPDRGERISLKDQAGKMIAKGGLVDPQNETYRTTAYVYEYSQTGTTVITQLPNYFHPPDPAYKEKWKVTTKSDMFGRQISVAGPDAGTREMVYDLKGALRFVLNATASAGGYFLYTKYDAASRALENGSIEGEWNRAELQTIADNDPAWPPTPSTWQQTFAYDGDGSNPLQMARLITTAICAAGESDSVAAVEIFEYDAVGNVARHTLDNLDADAAFSVTYTYDNSGNTTLIRYPAGGAISEIAYAFDQLGLTTAIGDATAYDKYALYEYNADGSPKTALLAKGSAAETLRSYEYASTGWPSKISDGYFSETLYYNTLSNGSTGYYDGLIAEAQYAYPRGVPAGGVDRYTYRYRYGALNQLSAAVNSVDGVVQPQWSLGSDVTSITYDANGNFDVVPRGATALQYAYEAGADKVLNTLGSDDALYAYDANGALTTAPAEPVAIRDVTYNRFNPVAERLTLANNSLQLQYGGRNQRIRKTLDQRQTLYAYGVNELPLIERIDDGADTRETRSYIYGPTGMIGFTANGRFYLTLIDTLNSTRALVDDTGSLIAAYNYMPYGGLMTDPGAAGAMCSYLFTGRELDREIMRYNFLARFYDPYLGRFWSPDPESQFASPYLFGANDPILYNDPDGEFVFVLSALAIGTALGAAGGVLAGLANGASPTDWKFWAYAAGGAGIGLAAAGLAVGGAVAGAAAGGAIAAAAGIEAGSVGASVIGIGGGIVGATAGGAASGAVQGGGMSALTKSLGGNAGSIGQEALRGLAIGAISGFGGSFFSAGSSLAMGAGRTALAGALRVGGGAITGAARGAVNSQMQNGQVDALSVLKGAGFGAFFGAISFRGDLKNRNGIQNPQGGTTFGFDVRGTRVGNAAAKRGMFPWDPNSTQGANPSSALRDPLTYFFGSQAVKPTKLLTDNLGVLMDLGSDLRDRVM